MEDFGVIEATGERGRKRVEALICDDTGEAAGHR